MSEMKEKVMQSPFSFPTFICRTVGCGFVVSETEQQQIHKDVECPRCHQCRVKTFMYLSPTMELMLHKPIKRRNKKGKHEKET